MAMKEFSIFLKSPRLDVGAVLCLFRGTVGILYSFSRLGLRDILLRLIDFRFIIIGFIGIVGRLFANGPGNWGSIESYQRLKKWYLIPPCLTLSIIRYISRVKWSNPGEGVAPSSTPRCSSYWKGSHRFALDYSRQLYSLYGIALCCNKKSFSFPF